MNATIISNNDKHYPVLLDEILSIISPQNGGTFIDCTFGQGGYSKAILKFPKTKIFALDRDIHSEKYANELKDKNQNRFFFHNLKFGELNKLNINNERVKAIIFDLGFSYIQIKDLTRGLSFNSTGPLDMRMGLNNFSASDVVNNLNQKELELIFKIFGDEKDGKKIARKIVLERKKNKIDTQKLVQIINICKRNNNKKIHNSTKIFQALRIFVNKEISELIKGLINSVNILEKNGILILVSFHSLEDKIIKTFFKLLSENNKISRYLPENKKKNNILKLKEKKPILPSENEIKINKPSRSAKLRYAFKISDTKNFEEEILKTFKYLIDIENFSVKL